MKRIISLTLAAVCLFLLAAGLSSCQKVITQDDFVAIEGDNISGAWVVGGTGTIAPERIEKIVPAYNGITEFKKFEKVEEKDAVIRIVLFSDHGDSIDIFKITYVGDNTFSVEVEGAATVQFNAVSEELFRAITEVIE